MKNMKNEFHIEGYLYEHTLEKKVSGPKSANPGTEYITGEIKIATDDELTNIVPVHLYNLQSSLCLQSHVSWHLPQSDSRDRRLR